MNRSLLVVGARPGSLGWHVARRASTRLMPEPWTVTTAGMHEEDVRLDLTEWSQVREFIADRPPFKAVVCTAGMNEESTAFNAADVLEQHLDLNCVGPIELLGNWLNRMTDEPDSSEFHFVAISSNSARIARSTGLAYCASKAALSMALRCAARECARAGVSIYGYEPGWLEGTPMSLSVRERLAESVHPHRIPSGEGIDPERMAEMIVRNLDHHSDLNGCMIRIDGGEQ